jgi:hypothetical protein
MDSLYVGFGNGGTSLVRHAGDGAAVGLRPNNGAEHKDQAHQTIIDLIVNSYRRVDSIGQYRTSWSGLLVKTCDVEFRRWWAKPTTR